MSRRNISSKWRSNDYGHSSSSDLNNRGIQAKLDGNHLRARKLFSAAIQIDPFNYRYYSNRASTKITLGEYESAIHDLDKSISYCDWNDRVQHSKNALFNKILCLYQLGRYDSAIIIGKDFIKSFPTDINTHRLVSQVYLEAGRHESAVLLMQEALILSNNSTRSIKLHTICHLSLAMTCAKQYKEVSEHTNTLLNTALASHGHFLNGYISVQLKEIENAINQFAKAEECAIKYKIDYNDWNYAKKLGLLSNEITNFIAKHVNKRKVTIANTSNEAISLIKTAVYRNNKPEMISDFDWNNNPYETTCDRCQMTPCHCSESDWNI